MPDDCCELRISLYSHQHQYMIAELNEGLFWSMLFQQLLEVCLEQTLSHLCLYCSVVM